MAAGDSDITICAQAVRRLGGATFTSFNDDVTGAGLCKDIYPTIRNAILGSHDWIFGLSKAQLSRNTTGPVSQWTNQFDLPVDRLQNAPYRVFTTSNALAPVLRDRWEVIGDKLMTEETEIWVDYISDVDEEKWPAWLVEVMVNAVAAEVAFSVTDNNSAAERYQIKTANLLQQARTRNAQSNPNRIMDDSELLDARFGPV